MKGFCFRINCRCQKSLFPFFRVMKIKLIEGCFRVSVQETSLKASIFVVALDEFLSSLKHKDDVLLKRILNSCVIKVRDAQGPRRCTVFTKFHKSLEQAIVTFYHL